jgi:hypothetical protein
VRILPDLELRNGGRERGGGGVREIQCWNF